MLTSSIANAQGGPGGGGPGGGLGGPPAWVGQNPMVVQDSMIIMNRLYANEKLYVSEDLRVEGESRLGGSIKMPNLATATGLTGASEILVVMPNGSILKTTINGILLEAAKTELDGSALCDDNGGFGKWYTGPYKLFTGCPETNVGIADMSPEHKLTVRGVIFGSKLLAGNSDATTDAVYNGFCQNNTQDLMQLGVKVGALAQTVKLRVLNSGSIEMINSGSSTSLKISNGTGHAVVIYSNSGSKILQLEDNGTLRGRKIKVDTDSWADYVFKQGYKLMTLKETEDYITANGHLPGIPSEEQIKSEGLDLGEMQKMQMEKIEEMYLHIIEMDKKITALQEENAALKEQISKNN